MSSYTFESQSYDYDPHMQTRIDAWIEKLHENMREYTSKKRKEDRKEDILHSSEDEASISEILDVL